MLLGNSKKNFLQTDLAAAVVQVWRQLCAGVCVQLQVILVVVPLLSHTEPHHQTLCNQYRLLGILYFIFKKRVTEIFSHTSFSFSHTHPVEK